VSVVLGGHFLKYGQKMMRPQMGETG